MIPILAVDPSLTATGWATHVNLPHGTTRTDTGVIHPRNPITGRKLPDPQRMLHTAGHIRTLARRYDTHLVALEGPSYASKSSSTDRIDGLHWTIRATLWGARIPYIVVPPATVKMYATGYGRAPKRTGPDGRGTIRTGMVDAARDELHYAGRDDNIADALWIHALVADALGQDYLGDDPHGRRREALQPVLVALRDVDLLTGTPT